MGEELARDRELLCGLGSTVCEIDPNLDRLLRDRADRAFDLETDFGPSLGSEKGDERGEECAEATS